MKELNQHSADLESQINRLHQTQEAMLLMLGYLFEQLPDNAGMKHLCLQANELERNGEHPLSVATYDSLRELLVRHGAFLAQDQEQ